MDLEHLESQVATVQPGRRALDSAASLLDSLPIGIAIPEAHYVGDTASDESALNSGGGLM